MLLFNMLLKWFSFLLESVNEILKSEHSNETYSAEHCCGMSRYWTRGKFGEHKRGVRAARGAAESNSSLLSALQTSQVLNISTYTQLKHELIVL